MTSHPEAFPKPVLSFPSFCIFSGGETKQQQQQKKKGLTGLCCDIDQLVQSKLKALVSVSYCSVLKEWVNEWVMDEWIRYRWWQDLLLQEEKSICLLFFMSHLWWGAGLNKGQWGITARLVLISHAISKIAFWPWELSKWKGPLCPRGEFSSLDIFKQSLGTFPRESRLGGCCIRYGRRVGVVRIFIKHLLCSQLDIISFNPPTKTHEVDILTPVLRIPKASSEIHRTGPCHPARKRWS